MVSLRGDSVRSPPDRQGPQTGSSGGRRQEGSGRGRFGSPGLRASSVGGQRATVVGVMRPRGKDAVLPRSAKAAASNK